MPNQAVTIKQDLSLSNEEWYQHLLEDCRAITVERVKNVNYEIFQYKWELGERVFQENDRMERDAVYGKKIVESLANDLGKSSAELYNCIQCYKENQAPTFEKSKLCELLADGTLTWSKYLKEHLGGRGGGTKEKVKRVYKLEDILEVVRAWLIEQGYEEFEEDLDRSVGTFKDLLVKTKKN